MNAPVLTGPAAITPDLEVPDPHAAYWLSQVHIRLRREIGWCWHQRLGRSDPRDGSLPAATEPSTEVLDWVRFADQKRRFLTEDPAGGYLTACLRRLERPVERDSTWAFAATTLDLDDAAQFLLALGVSQHLDAGLGPVFAACANDLGRPYPTAALAQRLWDGPAAITRILVDDHPLFRSGLIRSAERAPAWQRLLDVPISVANAIIGLDRPAHAGTLPVADARLHRLDEDLEMLGRQLARRAPPALEIVALRGPVGADYRGWAAALAAPSGRPLWPVQEPHVADADALCERSTIAWLHGADILLPELQAERPVEASVPRCLAHGVRWFVPVHGAGALAGVPTSVRRVDAALPPLGYEQRLTLLMDGLGSAGEKLRKAAAECARRFRLEAPVIRRIAADLRGVPGLNAAQLAAACRGAATDRHDDATQQVAPRFTGNDLVLPAAQMRQFHEIRNAMRMLTEVHYGWGTARVWNEGGLAVLFCGPPGTGKTMAAEALAKELDLDLYRIDLSQVVNKYIGETEKNLRRVFDAAEASDCILFFDEADALFGKRTEVKDAHDRFANIEISYLLERMERFKGLAILATNRRKHLDEAFMRRLRYVVEFPIPGVPERERIWRAGIPARVDAEELDFRFLAKQFALSGGHIRSVIFNACLQAAGTPPEVPLPNGKVGRLTMRDVLVQVKRELDKLNRAASDEQFGAYAQSIAEWAA
jgi:hypothetical protein